MLKKNKLLHAVIRRSLVGCAVLWLLVEALAVLHATFGIPCSFVQQITEAAKHSGIEGLIGKALQQGVPTIFFTCLVLIWQELRRWAKKWFKTHRGRQSANLIITVWFVYLATLVAVDHLTDKVTLVLPQSARETSVVLAYVLAATWCSRFAHWMKRQLDRFARIQRRYRASAQDTLTLRIALMMRRMKKRGWIHDSQAPWHHRTTHRRAAQKKCLRYSSCRSEQGASLPETPLTLEKMTYL